jgi:hypothetical protein
MNENGLWINVYALYDLKNAIIKIEDGTEPTANSITVKIGEGTVSWTETVARRYIKNRGVLDDVRNEDEEPLEVNFSFMLEYYMGTVSTGTGTSATTGVPSVMDALKQINAAAAWVSSDSDTCRPYAVNIVITYTPTPSTCGDIETITIPDFRYESVPFDLNSPEAIVVTGKANVTEPIIVRTPQTT